MDRKTEGQSLRDRASDRMVEILRGRMIERLRDGLRDN